MQSKVKKEITINQFQDVLTPSVGGIVWITDDKLEDRPNYFEHIDYFLDGAMAGQLSSEFYKENQVGLFYTKHFGKQFFVMHVSCENKDFLNTLDKNLDMVPYDQRNCKLLLVNTSEKEVSKKVAKKHQWVSL